MYLRRPSVSKKTHWNYQFWLLLINSDQACAPSEAQSFLYASFAKKNP